MEENVKYPLERKTIDFSVHVIKYCATLKEPIFRPIVDQLVRSATSIGANYAEANNAASRTDFRAKIYIAKKEAAETKYWLRLLRELGGSESEAIVLIKEAQGLLMTLQKIINTLRENSENGKLKTYRKQEMEN